MSKTTTEPSAGAMRATKVLMGQLRAAILSCDYVDDSAVAAIIDAETGLPELLAACEAAHPYVKAACNEGTRGGGPHLRACRLLTAAIAKAKDTT